MEETKSHLVDLVDPRQPDFQLPDRGEVLVNLLPVGLAELPPELLGVFQGEVEDALPLGVAGLAGGN